MKHYDYEINLFADCELEEEKREELFSHLVGCKECQNLLADLLLMKEKSRTYCADNITKLQSAPKRTSKFYKIGFYSSAAAAVILLFLLTTAKPKETYITKNEVRIDTVFVQKEIPIAQLQKANSNSFTPGKKELKVESSQKSYLLYVNSLHSIKITDADVIQTRNGS
jgi:hypothetical protein